MKTSQVCSMNKLKLACFSILFCLTLLLVIHIFYKILIVEGQEKADRVESYIEIHIKPGDTLWYLANKFGNSKKDIRKVIFEICEVNQLDTADIYPGQIIKIPIE